MSDAMVRLHEERARMAADLEAARQMLAGFDRAIELMGGIAGGGAALEAPKPLALPAPRRKGRRKTASPKAARTGDAQESDREKRLRALWPSDKPTPAIAQELGCSTTYCYQLAKKLKLGKRPGSARAKRAKRAKKAAAKPSADPAPALTIPRRSPSPPAAASAAPAPASSQPAPVRRVPPPPRKDEDAQVAAFIAEKGVTRAVDFGPHQAIVDAARSVSWDVLRLKTGYQQPAQWSLNGAAIRTAEVYRRVNAEPARRARPPVAMPQEEPAQ